MIQNKPIFFGKLRWVASLSHHDSPYYFLLSPTISITQTPYNPHIFCTQPINYINHTYHFNLIRLSFQQIILSHPILSQQSSSNHQISIQLSLNLSVNPFQLFIYNIGYPAWFTLLNAPFIHSCTYHITQREQYCQIYPDRTKRFYYSYLQLSNYTISHNIIPGITL